MSSADQATAMTSQHNIALATTTSTDHTSPNAFHAPEMGLVNEDVTSLASSGSISGSSSTGDCDSVLNSSLHSLCDDNERTPLTSHAQTRSYVSEEAQGGGEEGEGGENGEAHRWRLVKVMDEQHRIDLHAIDPYKKVISHGGTCRFTS